MESMLAVDETTKKLVGLVFQRIETIPGSTFKDNSTVIVVPTRGMIHHKVVGAWQGMMAPMNQKRAMLFAAGHEVGQAYNALVSTILAEPNLSKWKYLMTLEDDNLPPPDAQIRLLESIELGFDAVSGIYFTKGDLNMPMAYGDPDEFRRTGQIDFRPRNVLEALQRGQVMEVNGIAMGCALWRMDLFRELPAPWFVTVSDYFPEKGGGQAITQDLWLCERARRAGKKFAVDFRVKVGHLDIETGVVY